MVSMLSNQAVVEAKAPSMLNLHKVIQKELDTNCIVQLRGLVCESHGRVIVLRGQVDSYYLKQLAQELVRKVDSTVSIANLVQVN